jgi:CHAT domain-containing protein
MSDVFVQHFLLAAQRMGDRRLAFEVVERARGRITADSLRARVLAPQTSSRNKGDPEQKRIAALQQALIRTTSERERKRLLAELFEAEQSLTPADGRASGSGVDLRAQPVSLVALQRSLRPDEILLEYVLADPVSFCLAVDRRSSALIPLHGRTRIEREVREHLKHINARSAAQESGRELFSALLHPAAELERKARLIVVPDGMLNNLSFDTLVGADGRYVAESHTVSVAPSGTALHLLRAMPTRPGVERALVVGGVQYEREKALLAQNAPKESPDAGTRGMAELRLAALSEIPKTEDEAKAIAALNSGNATLLAGDRATEAMLKAQSLDRYGILHLATHGISDVKHPERAALILGSDPGAGEDGLLQAREIANLRLRAELVVLSACNTGEGRIEGQEGVANLVRAFFRAGSRTVVASQWPADDTATLAVMKEFYGQLAAGKDRGSALAGAKRGLISRFGKDAVPFYWGAFTMVGEAAMPVSLKN